MKLFWISVAVLLMTSPIALAQQLTAQQNSPATDAKKPESTHSTFQQDSKEQESKSDAPDEKPAIFVHPKTDRFWISGQMNFIFQSHPSFHAAYSGQNSFKSTAEAAVSSLMTLYTGVQVSPGTEFLLDFESAGGKGISDALGLAGFTNLDVVRNPQLGPKPYFARMMLHQVFALSSKNAEAERSPFSLASHLPERRIEFRIGKMGVADFFDLNSVGSDSHLQFNNWTIDNNGAYDYAADTRGYTYGAIIEYQQKQFGVRFGEMLMPLVANGIDLDWNLRRARAENLEFELRPALIASRSTVVRLLGYLNHANMGGYQEAINAFRTGMDSIPDIQKHRHQGTLKHGFGFNMEQELTKDWRAFTRIGWDEGKHESFAYTEANNTFAVGTDLKGTRWGRKLDQLGTAFVANGISSQHRQYLALGGSGFLLGDGRLNYGHEIISESYYTAHLWRGIFSSALLQYIVNPGYNRDRGPVVVPGFRVHLDF